MCIFLEELGPMYTCRGLGKKKLFSCRNKESFEAWCSKALKEVVMWDTAS